ncbi:hypothetical protein HID58_053506 [Brassica napus]|uniref:Myb/SANT-like DNA-binding domain-containing protein n=1 Tax=Brassica napus TaxID=3708 RepID=A0ABQ8AEW7_BRANA|nr:hypothetical protein HID58_053506 [Brassica napus]
MDHPSDGPKPATLFLCFVLYLTQRSLSRPLTLIQKHFHNSNKMEPNAFSAFDPRMLTLETPQNPPNPVQFQHPHPYSTAGDQHPHHQQPLKSLYPRSSKAMQLSPLSVGDEEDRGSGSGSGCHPEDSVGTDGKRRVSQWHRMKWTDTMVRLLIMAVYYIGDEAMVEKGFSVSPQQCEDKFNDLNKRYKRVNDILGKGTACRVVENQALLETMDHHLTPKLKDEVKKLLNSKHLFFKEMCAYHNSCGHLDQPQQPSQDPSRHRPEQQSCIHAAEVAEESETAEDSESEMEEEETSKKRRRGEGVSGALKRMREETARALDEPGKSAWEKKEWMRRKALELEERKVGYEWEAVEMEKERVKWMRYRSKKEREMEKAKLENQRRMLETERMVLILRRREIELVELQSLGKRVDPSSATGRF